MTCTRLQHRAAAAGALIMALFPMLLSAQTPPVPTTPQPAAASQALPTPQVSIADVTEDKQRLLRATVTLGGEPLQSARIAFGVARTFGVLDLGSDTSLDDGTAAIPFPEGLPGDAAGTFEVVVSVEGAKAYSPTTLRTRIGGAGTVARGPEGDPHELWSSKPLWPLVTVIVVLLTCVWSVYVFVIAQLVKIRREEYPDELQHP